MIEVNEFGVGFARCYVDKLTPRQRLSHKLRDGKYRARLAGCQADLIRVDDVLWLLMEEFCFYCGGKLGTLYTLEHKIPLKLGGSHTIDNLAKACPECNQEKHIQTELDYLARLDKAS